MSRLLHWLLVCTAALLLPAVAAQARPETAEVTGLIWSVSPDSRPATLTIEGGEGFITLEVTRRTSILFSPPPPPGETEPGEGFDLLLPGRSVEVAYNPKTLQALRIGVGFGQPQQRIEGTLVGAPSGNQLTVDDGEEQHVFTFGTSSQFYLGETRISQDQAGLLAGSPVELYLTFGGTGVEALRAVPAAVNEIQGRVESVAPFQHDLTLSGPVGTTNLTLAVGARAFAKRTEVPVEAIAAGDRARVLVATTTSGALVALQVQLLNVDVRVASGTLNVVNPNTRYINVGSGRAGAYNYRVLETTPITVDWDGVQPASLQELAMTLPSVSKITARVEYVIRDGARIVTRVDATVKAVVPPPPPSGR